MEGSFEVEVCNEIAGKSSSPFAFRNLQNETPQFKFHASATRFPSTPHALHPFTFFNKQNPTISLFLSAFTPFYPQTDYLLYMLRPDILSDTLQPYLANENFMKFRRSSMSDHKLNSYEFQHTRT